MSTPVTPPVVAIDSKKLAEFQSTVPQLLAQARDCEIVAPDDFIVSGSLLDRIIEREKLIYDFFDQPAKQAHSLHKFVTSLRSALLEQLEQAETLLKDRRRDWRAEQERQRLAIEEEQRRVAKEQEDNRAIEEAAQLAAIGETEAAETIIERAASAPPPPVMVASSVPKEKGHSFRTVYKYRVTNPTLHKREFLILDESKTQSVVTKLGPDAASIVGGIEVYSEEQEIVRARR